MKLLDNFGPAAAIKAAVPSTVIVGRIYLSNQPQDGDPVAAAQAWFNSNRGTIQNYPCRAVASSLPFIHCLHPPTT